MTIASVVTAIQFACNGSTAQFSFPNKIFAAGDLVVTLIDPNGNTWAFPLQANGTLGLSYTVSNVDVDAGCYITFNTPPSLNWTLDMRTRTPETQSTSIKNQGAFLPELHEEAFDRLTRLVQDLYRQGVQYSVHANDLETTPWPAMPPPAQRLGLQLVFDPVTGLPAPGIPNAAQTITTGLLSSFLGLLGPGPTTAETAAGVVPTNLGYVPGDLRRYGADPTGAADSTVAFTQAIAVQAQSGPVGGGLPIIVDGTFVCKPTASFVLNGMMRGFGINRSIIKADPSLLGTNPVFIAQSHCEVIDLAIGNAIGTTGTSIGLYVGAPIAANFSGGQRIINVSVGGWHIGISIGAVFVVALEGLTVQNNDIGEYCVPAPAAGGYCTTVNHVNCFYNANGQNLFWNPSVNCYDISFYGAGWQDSTGASYSAYFNQIFNLKLESMYTEGNVTQPWAYFNSVSYLSIDTFVNNGGGPLTVIGPNCRLTLKNMQHGGQTITCSGNYVTIENCDFPVASNVYTPATTRITSSIINGITRANLTSGWGTPTGGSAVANFPGASATLLQTSTAVAQLIADLKAQGLELT